MAKPKQTFKCRKCGKEIDPNQCIVVTFRERYIDQVPYHRPYWVRPKPGEEEPKLVDKVRSRALESEVKLCKECGEQMCNELLEGLNDEEG